MPPPENKEAPSDQDHDAPPSLLNLPNEMLLEIASKLEGDNTSLAALSGTSNHLKSIAVGLLYKYVNIGSNGGYRGAYLARTLLEDPTRRSQVTKISLTLHVDDNSGSRSTIDVAKQPSWVSLMMTHFANLNHNHTDVWISQVFSSWTDAVTFMLLTLLPHATDVQIFVYERAGTAMPYTTSAQAPENELVILNHSLRSLLTSSLGHVKRLAILGATMSFMRCCTNVEVVDLNLVGERSSEGNTHWWNILKNLTLTSLVLMRLQRLHTLILRCHSSLLHPEGHLERRVLERLFVQSRFPVLVHVKIYIIRGPGVRLGKDTSFANVRSPIFGLTKTLESLTIDYVESPALEPKVLLSECSRMDSFGAFTKLRNLAILQEVFISLTDRARISSWESSTSTFFPPALELLTIICPTPALLQWLRVLSITGAPSTLREIVLLCRLGHGAAPTEFQDARAKKCFEDLLDMGITVTVKEELPGSFRAHARAHGSVWEADWAEENWTGDLFEEEN